MVPSSSPPNMLHATGGALPSSSASSSSSSSSHPGLYSCFSCRKRKRTCDRHFPCARCQRLGLECVMQTRGRGRPAKVAAAEEPQGRRPQTKPSIRPSNKKQQRKEEEEEGQQPKRRKQEQPSSPPWAFTSSVSTVSASGTVDTGTTTVVSGGPSLKPAGLGQGSNGHSRRQQQQQRERLHGYPPRPPPPTITSLVASSSSSVLSSYSRSSSLSSTGAAWPPSLPPSSTSFPYIIASGTQQVAVNKTEPMEPTSLVPSSSFSVAASSSAQSTVAWPPPLLSSSIPSPSPGTHQQASVHKSEPWGVPHLTRGQGGGEGGVQQAEVGSSSSTITTTITTTSSACSAAPGIPLADTLAASPLGAPAGPPPPPFLPQPGTAQATAAAIEARTIHSLPMAPSPDGPPPPGAISRRGDGDGSPEAVVVTSSPFPSSSSLSMVERGEGAAAFDHAAASEVDLVFEAQCQSFTKLKLAGDIDIGKVKYLWCTVESMFRGRQFAGRQFLRLLSDAIKEAEAEEVQEDSKASVVMQQQQQTKKRRPSKSSSSTSGFSSSNTCSTSSSNDDDDDDDDEFMALLDDAVALWSRPRGGVKWVDELFSRPGAAAVRLSLARRDGTVDERVVCNDMMCRMFMTPGEIIQAATELDTLPLTILCRLMADCASTVDFAAGLPAGMKKGLENMETAILVKMRDRRGVQVPCIATSRWHWDTDLVILVCHFSALPCAPHTIRTAAPLRIPPMPSPALFPHARPMPPSAAAPSSSSSSLPRGPQPPSPQQQEEAEQEAHPLPVLQAYPWHCGTYLEPVTAPICPALPSTNNSNLLLAVLHPQLMAAPPRPAPLSAPPPQAPSPSYDPHGDER